MRARLTKELSTKYNTRSLRVRKGDKVIVLRGQFKKKEGLVERLDIARERVFIAGVEFEKKNGSKVSYPVHPSNVMITTVVDDDKRRFKHYNNKEKSK